MYHYFILKEQFYSIHKVIFLRIGQRRHCKIKSCNFYAYLTLNITTMDNNDNSDDNSENNESH